MSTHDCKNCKISGNCPIESIAPWLNEHEEETVEATRNCSDDLATACTGLVISFPPILVVEKAVVSMAQACFMLGYQKGRTYQDVPQVFKDSLG